MKWIAKSKDTLIPNFIHIIFNQILMFLMYSITYSSRPKAVTGPYYPDTITKSDEHDGDNLKNGIYATNLSGHPGLPGHPGHPGHPGQLSNGKS